MAALASKPSVFDSAGKCVHHPVRQSSQEANRASAHLKHCPEKLPRLKGTGGSPLWRYVRFSGQPPFSHFLLTKLLWLPSGLPTGRSWHTYLGSSVVPQLGVNYWTCTLVIYPSQWAGVTQVSLPETFGFSVWPLPSRMCRFPRETLCPDVTPHQTSITYSFNTGGKMS